MSDEQTIYISPEDDLTTVRERLGQTPGKRLTLVIPTQTQLRSHVAWKLLYGRARELGKEVLIVSSDPQVRSVAHAVKFKVAHSLESSPLASKARGGSRAGRSPGKSRAPGGSRTPTREPGSRGVRSVSGTSERGSGSLGQESPAAEPQRTWYGAIPGGGRERDIPPIEDLGADDTLTGGPPLFGMVDRSPDFQHSTTPPVYPLGGIPIDEPDLLQEDYTQAQVIRQAASEGRRRQKESSQTSRPDVSEHATQIPDDPFISMEDSQPPPRAEQRGEAVIEEYDAPEYAVQSVDDLPTSEMHSGIAYRAEGDESKLPITNRPERDDDVHNISPARTHGMRPRKSRSGYLASPPPAKHTQKELDDDALPEIDERPTQLFPPSSSRRSAPLQPRQTSARAETGSTEDRSGKRASRELTKGRTGTGKPVSSELTKDRSAKRPSESLAGSRPNAGKALVERAVTTPASTEKKDRPSTAAQPAQRGRTGTTPLPPGAGRSAPSARPGGGRGTNALAPAISRSGTGARRPTRPARRGISRGSLIAGTIAVILLLSLVLLAYFVPSAQVVLTVEARDYTHDITAKAVVVPAGSSAPAQTMPGQQMSKTFTKPGEGKATGTKAVGTDAATGVVTFKNEGDTSIIIPSGIVITTKEGNIPFVTDAEGLVSAGEEIPIPIKAQKEGEQGNVAEKTITVIPEDSLNKIAQTQTPPVAPGSLKLTVSNDASTKGGGAQPKKAVTADDLTKTRDELVKQLQGEIDQWTKDLARQGFVGTPQLKSELQNSPQPDSVVEAETFPATVKVIATSLLVPNDTLQKEATRQLNDFMGKEQNFKGFEVLESNESKVKLEDIKQKSGDANALELTFKASAQAVPAIEESQIQSIVTGKSPVDARNALKDLAPQVKSTDIQITPGFMPVVTYWQPNITVLVQPTTPSAPEQ